MCYRAVKWFRICKNKKTLQIKILQKLHKYVYTYILDEFYSINSTQFPAAVSSHETVTVAE